MNETPNAVVEITKILTGFITDNSIAILFAILLIICKDAISNFISRLISLSYKKGDSEIGFNAVAPVENKDPRNNELSKAEEKPIILDSESEIDGKAKEENWFFEMHTAFSDGNIELAETIFKKYALDEKDEINLEKNKSIYLYFRFSKGKDNSAIAGLEELVRTAKTEESKIESLEWLSLCLKDSLQIKKEISLWQQALDSFKTESILTKAIVSLASVLDRDEQSHVARHILIERLSAIEDDEQKALLYYALSKTEESLGNKTASVYCKDKALEYDPNNRDELFNLAYFAGNEKIDDISLSNYLKLIRIDSQNSMALNNIGVRAQEAGLKIKAIENYKEAAINKNTLAMANQGYLLLDAGFTEEAEEIAKKALGMENIHPNVHSLIAQISERKKTQITEWDKLSEKSFNRQKLIRLFTEQSYLGNSKDLEGFWFTHDKTPINIVIKNNELESSWEEPVLGLTGVKYTIKIAGQVSGSTFTGKCTKNKNSDAPYALLGLPESYSHDCIGFLSEDNGKITVISQKLKDDFSLKLTRM